MFILFYESKGPFFQDKFDVPYDSNEYMFNWVNLGDLQLVEVKKQMHLKFSLSVRWKCLIYTQFLVLILFWHKFTWNDVWFLQKWDKIFKSGLIKFCGRQPLRIYLVQSWILCLKGNLYSFWSNGNDSRCFWISQEHKFKWSFLFKN